ncbi:hypothetical protein [uncultured Mediterranean phage uvMED]|nr:hypothetical protein [uncultured Mediterranean phage uvMED]
MAANVELPAGFTLDPEPSSELPEGFTLDIPEDERLELLDLPGDQQLSYSEEPLSASELATGAAETLLESSLKAVPGMAGYLKGSIEGVYRRFIEEGFTPEQAAQLAQETAAEYTKGFYTPDSRGSQKVKDAIGDITDVLPPVLATPAIASAAAGMSAKGALNAAKGVPGQALKEAKQLTSNYARARQDKKDLKNIGAAELESGRLRQERINELPVPVKLTKGQKTQNLAQQKFEREVAKTDEGRDLLKRFDQQNEALTSNLDAFIDETGTTIGEGSLSKTDTGRSISKAIQSQKKLEKEKVRRAYDIADKSPGAKQVVNLGSAENFINNNKPLANYNGNVLDAFEKEAKRMNLGGGSFNDGDFRLNDMTVKDAEHMRKFINLSTDKSNPKDIMLSAGLKKMIDQDVGQLGGAAYKRARNLRKRLSQKYENQALVRDLIANKPNTTDRKIALEKVSQQSIKTASAEQLKGLTRLLQESQDGRQALKDLRGQAVKDIKEGSYNLGQDQDGNRRVSAKSLQRQIKDLDQSGKLDILFGKKGAEQMRTLSDAAQDILVSQPGAVNTSNTATTLLALIDLIGASMTGMPLPVLSALGYTKDKLKTRSTKQKVKEALR